MTPEERRKWERENPKDVNQGPRKSWKFMQKYWHKGAFYQDVSDNPHATGSKPDEIFSRDYSAPTGEDKLNKEILPKVSITFRLGKCPLSHDSGLNTHAYIGLGSESTFAGREMSCEI